MIEPEQFFRGLQKTTVIDFPGKVACVLFVGGCNFRCPYCYNRSLVEKTAPILTWEEVFAFLHRRKRVLDGVCISGGEPTLAPFLPGFLREVKKLGLEVKLDTNGSKPEVLEALFKEGLLDYVAMDVKNSPGKYATTSGLPNLDLCRLSKTIDLIKASGVPYELRTTVALELHGLEDIQAMAQFVGGGQTFALQAVDKAAQTLSGMVFTPPSRSELEEMRQILGPHFGRVIIRARG